MDSNGLLWIGQILLALGFLGAGYGHTVGFSSWSTRPGMGWLAAVGRDQMRVIGGLEIVAAVGLVVPAATGVLPWLTPVAATALAVLMVLAIAFHARRAEGQSIVLNAILGVVAALVAYGRFIIAP
jgi:DoxX-like protein